MKIDLLKGIKILLHLLIVTAASSSQRESVGSKEQMALTQIELFILLCYCKHNSVEYWKMVFVHDSQTKLTKETNMAVE